ncbi:MAG: TIGR01777 family protein [Chlorobi bacterium]|nr:TIGR01777 family protein [Chlorobiota bacterium]
MSEIVVVTGGTGMVGSYTVPLLRRSGYRVHILTRHPERYRHLDTPGVRYFGWDWTRKEADPAAFDDAAYLIHLAGANIGEHRWTSGYRALIAGSRILSLRFLREFLRRRGQRIIHVAGASAIGYYGCTTDDRPRTEEDPPGRDFLARVVTEWEEETRRMEEVADGVTVLRTGVVLDPRRGAFPKMIRPLRFKLPLILGSGRQYLNWISGEDTGSAYLKALNERLSGVFNTVAPRPVTYREFIATAARLKGLPCCLPPVPAFLLKAVLGEMACLVTEGMPVSARKWEERGLTFRYREAEEWLRDHWA